MNRRPHALLLIAALPALAYLLIPLVALGGRLDVGQFAGAWRQPAVSDAIRVSLGTSLGATLLAVVGGTPLAWLLARHQFRGQRIVDTLVDLPMVLPPAVAGIALLLVFGRRGPLGGWLESHDLTIAFSPIAVVLAQCFVAAPYYVRTAVGGFAAVERELEHAAALDGASALQTFRLVTVPLAGPALIGGVVMTWARALGEFGATIIFAGNLPGLTQTMPLAIYLGFERDLQVALTLAAVLLAISFAVLALTRRILWRADER
jgi:molybdate transport system permease protein